MSAADRSSERAHRGQAVDDCCASSNQEDTMTKTDNQLRQDIEDELRWDPKVNAARIAVSVDTGAVTLLGAVDTYAEKWAAEDATKRVSGVRTVAQDLTVKVLDEHKRIDSELAAVAQSALRWNVLVPRSITAKVDRGIVTLEGEVSWNFERHAAERAIRYLAGVVSVTDAIALKHQPSPARVKEDVEAALHRQANADADSIHVATSGGRVTLTGHASSWRALEDAANAAWAAQGVTDVIDETTISLR
jgi:osmotically-inducible protein OsmY